MSAARTVWKFPVPFPGPDAFTIEMPAGAEVMAVHMQHGQPQMWALVDPSRPAEARRFRIAGTGHPINEQIEQYVGTFLMYEGELVFHVFEVVAP
jgi:hypothetical protein